MITKVSGIGIMQTVAPTTPTTPAPPQAVTPTTGTSSTAAGADGQLASTASSLGKDDFLKLLVAQMQNQDPDQPMDGTQLATQLAQFSSVEQLLNISDTLTAQSASNTSMLNAIDTNAAMGTIGKVVAATGNDVMVTQGQSASVTVDVAGAGGQGTLKIYDDSGTLVGQSSLGAVGGGRQTIDVGSADAGLVSGHYTYAVNVVDSSNAAVNVTTYTIAQIDGVQYTSSGPVLTSGPIQIPYSNVVQVGAGN